MKQKFYISLLLVSVYITALTDSFGQIVQPDLPMVCAGSISKYGVIGLKNSNFVWTITSPSNAIVPYTPLNAGADSISILWNDTYEGGIYSFSVVETTELGYIGDPYQEAYIVLNTNTMSIPFVGVPSTVSGCFGTEAILDPGSFRNYFWTSNLSEDRTYITTQEGTYEVRLVDFNQSCTYNDISAVFNPLPNVWLGNDTLLFRDQSLVLDVFDPKIVTYQWSTTLDNVSSYTAYYNPAPQTISVKVTDENSCTNSDTINITSTSFNEIRIPAAFTPNGDGINDTWVFPGKTPGIVQDVSPYLTDVEVQVFNRWGKLVWQTKNNEAWDGKDSNGKVLPMDSYHFIIKFKLDGQNYIKKGSITIIR